jgi:hypothetical protein
MQPFFTVIKKNIFINRVLKERRRKMYNISKRFIIFFVIVAMVIIPFASTALAQEQDGEADAGKMTIDLLLMRPFGILAVVLGSAAFVVSLPFSAMGGNIEPAYEKMVAAPASYTFKRPLGSF